MADPEARVAITATDETAAAFKSANRNLEEFSGRTVKGARSAEQELRSFRRTLGDIISLYGAMRVVNFVGGWLKDAAQAKDATDLQKAAIDDLKRSYDGLHKSVQQSGLAIIEAFGADAVAGMNRTKGLLDQINEGFDLLKKNHPDIANAMVAAAEFPVTGGFAVNKALQGAPRFTTGGGIEGPSVEDLTGVSGKLQETLRPFPKLDLGEQVKNMGQILSPQLTEFIDQLKEGAKLTEEMRGDAEKQVEQWHRAQQLFAEGIIDKDTLMALRESLLPDEAIQVTARHIKEVKAQTEEWAKDLGRGMRSAFVDWISGAEMNFRDFLKRMAAEFVTSAIFKSLSSSFGAAAASGGGGGFAGFLAGLFGGFKAGGGPLDPGKWYIAGERGPEPIWGGGAGAFASGYGGGLNYAPTINIDARGADTGVEAKIRGILAQNNQRQKAEISDLIRRNRFTK